MQQIPLKNHDRVQALIQTGQLASVSSDYALVDGVVAAALEDLEVAEQLRDRYPSRAYVTAYDAGHKALSAFLQAQGLRVKATEGHHTLLLDVVTDQAPGLSPLISGIRAAQFVRHALHYPTGPVTPPTDTEVEALLEQASRLVRGVARLTEERAIPLFR